MTLFGFVKPTRSLMAAQKIALTMEGWATRSGYYTISVPHAGLRKKYAEITQRHPLTAPTGNTDTELAPLNQHDTLKLESMICTKALSM